MPPQAFINNFHQALPDEEILLEAPNMILVSSSSEEDTEMSSEEEGEVEILSFDAPSHNTDNNNSTTSESESNYEFENSLFNFCGNEQVEEHHYAPASIPLPHNMFGLLASDLAVNYQNETVQPSLAEENPETSEPSLFADFLKIELPVPNYCFFIKDLLDAEEIPAGFFMRKLNMLCDSSVRFLGTVIDVSFRSDHKIIVYIIRDHSGAIECYGEPNDLLERITIESKIEELKRGPETVESEILLVKLTSSLELLKRTDQHFLPGQVVEVVGKLRLYNHKCIFIQHATRVNDQKYKIDFQDSIKWLYDDIYPTIQYMPNLDENAVMGEDEESKGGSKDTETREEVENVEESSEEQRDFSNLEEHLEMKENETSEEEGNPDEFWILKEIREFGMEDSESEEDEEIEEVTDSDQEMKEEEAMSEEGGEEEEEIVGIEENEGIEEGKESSGEEENSQEEEKKEMESEDGGENKDTREENAEGGGIENAEDTESNEHVEEVEENSENQEVFFILAGEEEIDLYSIDPDRLVPANDNGMRKE